MVVGHIDCYPVGTLRLGEEVHKGRPYQSTVTGDGYFHPEENKPLRHQHKFPHSPLDCFSAFLTDGLVHGSWHVWYNVQVHSFWGSSERSETQLLGVSLCQDDVLCLRYWVNRPHGPTRADNTFHRIYGDVRGTMLARSVSTAQDSYSYTTEKCESKD